MQQYHFMRPTKKRKKTCTMSSISMWEKTVQSVQTRVFVRWTRVLKVSILKAKHLHNGDTMRHRRESEHCTERRRLPRLPWRPTEQTAHRELRDKEQFPNWGVVLQQRSTLMAGLRRWVLVLHCLQSMRKSDTCSATSDRSWCISSVITSVTGW